MLCEAYIDGLGSTIMFNDYLLLNIIDISFLLRTSGPSGNTVTEPPCENLWGLYPPPPNLVSKDLGDPILLCRHHSCIPTQETLCPHTFSFLCQPLRIGVAYSEQTSCCLRTWCTLCEWLLNIQNSWQSQILNSMRKSRPCPSQALTTVLQGEELRYESKMELSHGHIMLPPKLEVKF